MHELRVDTTVLQTYIHHPTDNTLLWDVVRVVTRLSDASARRWNCDVSSVFAIARVPHRVGYTRSSG